MATALEYDALKTGNASSAQETWEDIADAGTYEQVGASEHASAADASKAPVVLNKQSHTDTKRQKKIKLLEMKRNDLQKIYDSFRDNRTFTEDQMELCAQLRKVNSLLDDLHYKESSLSGQEIKRRKDYAQTLLKEVLKSVPQYKRNLYYEVAKRALCGINPHGTGLFYVESKASGSAKVQTSRFCSFEDRTALMQDLMVAVKSEQQCKTQRPSLHLLLRTFKIRGLQVDPGDLRLQAVVDLAFTAYEHTPAAQ